MYTVVHRSPDGKLEMNCVHGKHAAESTLTAPVSTQAKESQNEVE
jgi:hypothetical protein